MYKVLVVDDKPSQVEMICVMLSKIHNVECITAYSGSEAIKIAQQKQPNLVIMDWIMPAETLSGRDAVQQIKSDNTINHIPVIACSAASNLCDALKLGCVDYVVKPFSVATFLDKVQQHLS